MRALLKLKDKGDFYQSKYEFYNSFSFYVVIISAIASFTYFISDCQLFGRFAWETLIPRFFVGIPLLAYIFLHKKVKDYRILTVLNYFILHTIMWDTIGAIYYLPDKTHASEGFIIMHLMFLAIGFGAPLLHSTVAHFLLIGDILISNLFNHYANLDIMLSLGIPCMIGIIACNYYMTIRFYDHYELVEKLQYITKFDSLTGAYTRNILRELTSEDNLKFHEKLGNEIGVMVIDLDLFKEVNDNYGHLNGDLVLTDVCRRIKAFLKSEDYIIRWGGEEFVVILSETDFDKSYEIAEQIRREIEHSDNGVCRITVSIGVSQYDGISYKKAIDVADQALYEAKKNGRNRVERANPLVR